MASDVPSPSYAKATVKYVKTTESYWTAANRLVVIGLGEIGPDEFCERDDETKFDILSAADVQKEYVEAAKQYVEAVKQYSAAAQRWVDAAAKVDKLAELKKYPYEALATRANDIAHRFISSDYFLLMKLAKVARVFPVVDDEEGREKGKHVAVPYGCRIPDRFRCYNENWKVAYTIAASRFAIAGIFKHQKITRNRWWRELKSASQEEEVAQLLLVRASNDYVEAAKSYWVMGARLDGIHARLEWWKTNHHRLWLFKRHCEHALTMVITCSEAEEKAEAELVRVTTRHQNHIHLGEKDVI